MHGGVEIGGRVLDARVQPGQLGECPLASAELVARNAAAVPGEEVVQAQADFDQECPPLFGPSLLFVGQEPQWSGQHPGERAEDGNGGFQRLHIVRSDLEEPVALSDGLVNQAELAVLQVADTAMDHVRGRPAGALAVVAAFHQGDVDSLHCQVPEGSYPVDAATDDEDLGVRPFAQPVGRLAGNRARVTGRVHALLESLP